MKKNPLGLLAILIGLFLLLSACSAESETGTADTSESNSSIAADQTTTQNDSQATGEQSEGRATLDKFTLNCQQLPFEEALVVTDVDKQDIAIIEDKTYLLSDNKLLEYSYDEESLKFVKEINIGQTGEKLSLTNGDTLWLSDYSAPLISIKDGAKVESFGGLDLVAMHPSGKWGISYILMTAAECKKISYEDNLMKKSKLDFSNELDQLLYLKIDEKHIYASGYPVGETEKKTFVYNLDAELELTLIAEEYSNLGTTTYITETENGYLELHVGDNEVCLWDKNGQWIGAIDGAELFGEATVELCSAAIQANGDIQVLVAVNGADQAKEVVVFKLSGF